MAAASGQDTLRYDRATLGKPFEPEEFSPPRPAPAPEETPRWVRLGDLQSDTMYYGIGKSSVSQDEADDDARRRFAQHVEVSVRSIATQQISEKRDRLEENYNYESLVSTNVNLRGVSITKRFMAADSIFYALIAYSKSDYHDLVTREIQVSLAAEIRKRELAHQAREAMRADSLRHKIRMDSLELARKQAVIDSLDQILAMEQRRQSQEYERRELIKSRYAAFLSLRPYYKTIDVPASGTPETWVQLSGRWTPQVDRVRDLNLGVSIWLFSLDGQVFTDAEEVTHGDMSLKLQVLPMRGELYPVSLSLGWLQYFGGFAPENQIRFSENLGIGTIISRISNEFSNPSQPHSSFLMAATIGIPQINSHASFYLDKRLLSVANTWYPFPKNLGNAIAVINQMDIINSTQYRNRFDDRFQWQIGIRLIAVQNRFATLLSFEDHELWRLNFEFQY